MTRHPRARLKGLILFSNLLVSLCLSPGGIPCRAEGANVVQEIQDRLTPIGLGDVKVGGEISRRIGLTLTNNIHCVDVDNEFLAAFRAKNAHDGYQGFGKFIDSVARLAYYTRDEKTVALKNYLINAVIGSQETDGYIGTMSPKDRMWKLWDIHEVNYIICALVTDYKLFGNSRSLEAARKAADYILEHWASMPGDWEKRTRVAAFVSVTGLDRTMLTLYEVTGDRRYLEFELKQRDLENWDPGIVIGRRVLVEGHTYAYMASCLAQLELYRLMPNEKLLTPTREAIDFMTSKNGMCITGGVGQAEIWTDDQDGGRDLAETCSTCYQMRVYDSLLRLWGDSRYGDLIERTLYNTFFGAQSPDGKEICYFTPFEGTREGTHARCCVNNYRRMISDLPSLVFYRAGNGVAVNLYSPSSADVKREDGSSILIQQETDYPNSGHVLIRVDPTRPESFPLKLRIPSWCKGANLLVDGKRWETPCAPGTFAVIDRLWRSGDQIVLNMPMQWRLVRGRERQAGRVAVMRGPLVFCLDPRQSDLLNHDGAADDGRIMIETALIGPNPVPSNAARPGGIGCRLKAGTSPGGIGDEGNVTLTLTEFADPNGRACYFRVPDLSTAVPDELTTLSETNRGDGICHNPLIRPISGHELDPVHTASDN